MRYGKLIVVSLIAGMLISCAASPDNLNAATVTGPDAPPMKSASQVAAQTIAPVTH